MTTNGVPHRAARRDYRERSSRSCAGGEPVAGGENDQRVEKTVPGPEPQEYRDARDGRSKQRYDDLHEGSQPTRSIGDTASSSSSRTVSVNRAQTCAENHCGDRGEHHSQNRCRRRRSLPEDSRLGDAAGCEIVIEHRVALIVGLGARSVHATQRKLVTGPQLSMRKASIRSRKIV